VHINDCLASVCDTTNLTIDHAPCLKSSSSPSERSKDKMVNGKRQSFNILFVSKQNIQTLFLYARIAYYASWQWYDRNKLAAPANLDFTKVDRVNFAFFQTNREGDIWGTDSWAE
jgi:GH18 family chitinase